MFFLDLPPFHCVHMYSSGKLVLLALIVFEYKRTWLVSFTTNLSQLIKTQLTSNKYSKYLLKINISHYVGI